MSATTSTNCPCGSGSPESACCGPVIAGAPAKTAEALMRSRYTAYVRGAIDHILESHDPETREGIDPEATARWSRETEWLGLEILGTERGGEGDETGIVEFVARGKTGGLPFAQRERCNFRRLDGRWVYSDGVILREQLKRANTPGRNDPCTCGSGLKYKKCHGR